MNWYEIDLEPRDVLFFRDARPMDGSHIGHGGVWPLPSVWHQALLSAFHRRWPEPQPWENVANVDRHPRAGTGRFGSLVTVGLFPRHEDRILVPTPADIGPGHTLAQLVPVSARHPGNLPSLLRYMPAFFAPPSKRERGQWIALTDLERYLRGESFDLVAGTTLFDGELRPGIEIDPTSRATVEGKFYMAEYLRLRDNVRLAGFARCVDKKPGTDGCDVLNEWIQGGACPLILGGQSGTAYLNCRREKMDGAPLKVDAALRGTRVKWVLLTPAYFPKTERAPGGWLPSWIDPQTGQVRLKAAATARAEGERREAWRRRLSAASEIDAQLVAVRLDGPHYISGWNLAEAHSDGGDGTREGRGEHRPGPKATVALVPAGTVYYFEAASEEAARQLATALTGTPRSDAWGEKGFGMGVCGTWTELKNIGLSA